MFAPLLATVFTVATPASSLLATAPLASKAPPFVTPHEVAIQPANEKAVKALKAWLKRYRGGKINIFSDAYIRRVPLQMDWREHEIVAKESFAVKYGLAPKAGLADSTWKGDLEVIGSAVVGVDSVEAATLLVELASIGFEKAKYTREQAPHVVRDLGEKWLGKVKGDTARQQVVLIATGGVKLRGKIAVPMRGAALRGLGHYDELKYRQAIESQLKSPEAILRFHAAETLGSLANETSSNALIKALEGETDDQALAAIVDGLRKIYAGYLPKLSDEDPPAGDSPENGDSSEGDSGKTAEPVKKPKATARTLPASSTFAVRAALGRLGQTTWRGDMAILRLLDDIRSKDAIPALISVLETYRDNPDMVKNGKLSSLVKHRCHELLVQMTGAVFPASQPDKWRDLWTKEQDKIDVRQRHGVKTAATTVASGFCGIPVEGSRVVFILDLSGSMKFAMKRKDGDDSTRMDYARRELELAMNSISDQSAFNLITFDGSDEAEVWNKKLVPATPRNREKFIKHLHKLEPDGGTNLWSSLEAALEISRMTYGDTYEKVVDEIFLLSDGAPSAGEVLDPVEILRLVKEANRFAKVRINTVFISSEEPEDRRRRNDTPWMDEIKPEELMRRLAKENGGKCVIL
ncbi:MAG: VWA domain-containing protein [bacterium]|nr:VWA domain-containing protein [bacterium]